MTMQSASTSSPPRTMTCQDRPRATKPSCLTPLSEAILLMSRAVAAFSCSIYAMNLP